MNGSSATLARVGRLCVGCGACQAMASPGGIEMRMSDAGYLRPHQVGALSPEEDRRIAAVCPGLSLTREPANGHDNALWGPVIRVRVGYAKDETLRHHASSGGVLSAVLQFLLESGRIDRVVQTAADARSPISNATVESTTRQDILQAAGSRYAPSAPLSDLRHQLEKPGRFALVGKPCDIAAARALAKHDPRVNEKAPYLISFFCAGIPSVRGTRDILSRLGVREDEVASFRYRGDGWPGYATAVTRDGRRRTMKYSESWGDILSKHVQFRCKICPDGSGGFADFVCADAWYGDDRGYPIFEETAGRSLIITRTVKGEDVVRRAWEAGYLEMKEINIGEVAKMQPYQARRKMLVLSRLAALALLGHTTPRFRGLRLWRTALTAGVWSNAKSFLGMIWRILGNRID